MAIDRTGATMTGMINQKPNIPQAADLSAMNQQPAQDPTTMIPQTGASEESKMTTTLGGTQNLTDEEIDSLEAAMSPSVKDALSKIFPDLASAINQLGTDEPNVIFPLSTVKRFAMQRYGGESEEEAVQNFMADVISPDLMQAQMENQNNVPPENQPTETAGLMQPSEPEEMIDSPQNMETA
jgi:hypothetical protein